MIVNSDLSTYRSDLRDLIFIANNHAPNCIKIRLFIRICQILKRSVDSDEFYSCIGQQLYPRDYQILSTCTIIETEDIHSKWGIELKDEVSC